MKTKSATDKLENTCELIIKGKLLDAVRAKEEDQAFSKIRRFLWRFIAEQNLLTKEGLQLSYEVRGFGAITKLRQGEMSITQPDDKSQHTLTVRFVCSREGELVRQVTGKRLDIENCIAYLKHHRLAFKNEDVYRDNDDVRSKDDTLHQAFYLRCTIPVTIVVSVDEPQHKIRFLTRNFKELGEVRYVISSREVTDDFLNELGKAIIYEPSRFAEMAGYKVSGRQRGQLQDRLRKEAKAKDAELNKESTSKLGGLLHKLTSAAREKKG